MPFKKSDIDRLLAATGRKCVICSSLHNVQVHHVVPKEEGGSDTFENAVPLCPSCHDRVHVKHSSGRTTRDYSPEEVRLHLKRAILRFREGRQEWNYYDNYDSSILTIKNSDDSFAINQQIKISRVVFAAAARSDCHDIKINEADARSFVRGEAKRHPLMFQSSFSSIPLVFADDV